METIIVVSEITTHAVRFNSSEPAASEGEKMSAERFSTLAMRGIYYQMDEFWISYQPFLAFGYLSVYAPWVMRQVMKFVGPKRVSMLKSKENLFELKKLFGL